MKTMKFGIIGCGLMGREFASATLRWVHLKDEITKPEIIGVCDMNPASFEWIDKPSRTLNITLQIITICWPVRTLKLSTAQSRTFCISRSTVTSSAPESI